MPVVTGVSHRRLASEAAVAVMVVSLTGMLPGLGSVAVLSFVMTLLDFIYQRPPWSARYLPWTPATCVDRT